MKSYIKSIIFLSYILVGGNYVCGMDQKNKRPEPAPGRTIIATFNIAEKNANEDVLIINDSRYSEVDTMTGIDRIEIYKLCNNNEIQVGHRDGGNEDGKNGETHNFSSEGMYKIYYFFKEDVIITDMSYMFSWCDSLTNLDLSNFDTDDVRDMNNMCRSCDNLQSVEFGNKFNTNSVEDMSYMFSGCKCLTYLNLSNFNTNSVTNMSRMFSGCSSLTELKISNFTTPKVTDMSYMFYNCSSLTSLDLSRFNTNSVKNMSGMFYKCSSLKILDLSNFNTERVNYKDDLFDECSSLETVTTNDGYITKCFEGKSEGQVINQNKEEKKIEDRNNQNINNNGNQCSNVLNTNIKNSDQTLETQEGLSVNIEISNKNQEGDSQAKSKPNSCCCPCCKNR